VLANYLLVALGFYYNAILLDSLREKLKKNNAKTKKAVWIWATYAITVTIILISLLAWPQEKVTNPRFVLEARTDFQVIFSEGIVERLNQIYASENNEYMFCLAGHEEGTNIYVTRLTEEEILEAGIDYVKYRNDPPCQFEDSLGSIHSHPESLGCQPSDNDLFAFGEMKNPEPSIFVIHCGIDTFLIMKKPGEHQGLDYRSITWNTR